MRSWMYLCSLLVACETDLENTAPPPGDLSAYDPFAHIEAVRAFAGKEAKLISIEARGVHADGTIAVDYKEYGNDTDYRFLAKALPGDENDVPFATKFIDVVVNVNQPRTVQVSHGASDGHTEKHHKGMARRVTAVNRFGLPGTEAQVAPLPKCKTTDLWSKAVAKGTPKDARAMIRYDAKRYEFLVMKGADLSGQILFDHACNIVAE